MCACVCDLGLFTSMSAADGRNEAPPCEPLASPSSSSSGAAGPRAGPSRRARAGFQCDFCSHSARVGPNASRAAPRASSTSARRNSHSRAPLLGRLVERRSSSSADRQSFWPTAESASRRRSSPSAACGLAWFGAGSSQRASLDVRRRPHAEL